jgi:N-acetylglutamate synthase-like GNAT family acetyltransferase
MSEPSLRRATTADAAAIAQLVEGAYQKYVARIGRRPAPMDTDYAALVGHANAWVLTCGEQLVGSLVTYVMDDHVLLDSVAVAPDTQGRGYGVMLLRRAEDDAHEAGLTEVRLYTNAR